MDFNPPVDAKALRKKLLRDHEELVGKVRAFDGMVLFLPRRLPNSETELVSKLKEGDEVHIKIKLTNELQPDDPTCLQLINILFRRCERMCTHNTDTAAAAAACRSSEVWCSTVDYDSHLYVVEL